MPFTLTNIKDDLEDIGSNFDGAPDLEFRSATKALELDIRPELPARPARLSLSVRPHAQEARGGVRRHARERAYEARRRIVGLKNGTRARPARYMAGYEAGAEGLEILSSARPVSATLRAKTSMAGATGGLTSRARSARRCSTTRRHPRQRPAPDQARCSASGDRRTPSWSLRQPGKSRAWWPRAGRTGTCRCPSAASPSRSAPTVAE